MWNINAPQGHISCAIFTTFAKDALAVKISVHSLKELWSYGGFKVRGSGYPQIFIFFNAP